MDWFKNNLPLITLLMLILGMVNIFTYYNVFGINIISFLEISEVLQLQFSSYIILAWLLVLICSILYIPAEKLYKKVILTRAEKIELSARNLAEMQVKLDKLGERISAVNLNEFNSLVTTHNGYKSTHVENEKVLSSMKSLVKLFYMLMVFMLAATISVGDAFYSIFSLQKKSKIEVSMKINDKEIKTDKNYRFLGRTKNFIMFYSYDKREANVFSNSEVKDLTFKDGVDYTLIKEAIEKPVIKKP